MGLNLDRGIGSAIIYIVSDICTAGFHIATDGGDDAGGGICVFGGGRLYGGIGGIIQ